MGTSSDWRQADRDQRVWYQSVDEWWPPSKEPVYRGGYPVAQSLSRLRTYRQALQTAKTPQEYRRTLVQVRECRRKVNAYRLELRGNDVRALQNYFPNDERDWLALGTGAIKKIILLEYDTLLRKITKKLTTPAQPNENSSE